MRNIIHRTKVVWRIIRLKECSVKKLALRIHNILIRVNKLGIWILIYNLCAFEKRILGNYIIMIAEYNKITCCHFYSSVCILRYSPIILEFFVLYSVITCRKFLYCNTKLPAITRTICKTKFKITISLSTN